MYYFVGVDNARFRHPVEPGDQLVIEIELMRTTRGIWKVGGPRGGRREGRGDRRSDGGAAGPGA